MGGNKAKSEDFYQVLGLNKECTQTQLRNAYKKLALKWHPDRCLASKYVEESKKKFQAIQEAYSVLSNADKRFLYDVGVYDSDDDDDQNGMADFMSEMAVLMNQNKPTGNGETFEDLKDLFEEMFHNDIESTSQTESSSSSLFSSSSPTSSLKRASSAMSNTKTEDPLCFDPRGFCLGAGGRTEDRRNSRRKGRHGYR